MDKNKMPTISNYGDYSSGNYGAHTLRVDMPSQSKNKLGITLYYSYETIIAFRQAGVGLVISENVWGTTTGKHLNWVCEDKSIRIPYSKFEKELGKALKRA